MGSSGGAGGGTDGAGGTSVAAGGANDGAGGTSVAAGGANDAAGGAAGGLSATGTVAVGDDLDAWYANATVSYRNLLPVPGAFQVLQAEPIIEQLEIYDPGSLLRCEVQDDPAYREVVDAIGGVTWGYAVSILQDESQPRFLAGFPSYR